MSQYERMVSYIYAYMDGEKKENTGYAKIEKRGDKCRFTIQMRAIVTQHIPKVYLYLQKEKGIETIFLGQMQTRGTNLVCKAVTDSNSLFASEKKLEDIDGIFIDIQSDTCYCTTWKKDYFYLGDRTDQIEEENRGEETSEEEKSEEEKIVEEKIVEEKKNSRLDIQTENEKKDSQNPLKESSEEETIKDAQSSEEEAIKDVQMQSICNACPFRSNTLDYGEKILQSYPVMHPFSEGIVERCVQIEPKDIGCMPMSVWSLSGNRFLLHGYYCYRHLIFIRQKNKEYMLGVPGIYHEKEKQQAADFGFCDFLAIGDIGNVPGVFGYWLTKLPQTDQSAK